MRPIDDTLPAGDTAKVFAVSGNRYMITNIERHFAGLVPRTCQNTQTVDKAMLTANMEAL